MTPSLRRPGILIALFLFFIAACTPSSEMPTTRAKNVILFIGDGMGISMITAARIVLAGPDGKLAMEKLPHTAMVKATAADYAVADSAAGGTAMATGVKAPIDVVGEDGSAVFRKRHGKKLRTIIDIAKSLGKSTGIVTNRSVTNSTPAVFYAHHHDKDAEREIAVQFVEDETNVDVLLGGGRKYFKKLKTRLKEKGYRYVSKREDLLQIATQPDTEKLVGLFAKKHMTYEMERAQKKSETEPSLAEMMMAALSILSRNPNGYYLMVEGGNIDDAAHRTDPFNTIMELVFFDQVIGKALEEVSADTLILVTADHECGGFAVNANFHKSTKGLKLFGDVTQGLIAGKPILSWATGEGYVKKPGQKEPIRTSAHQTISSVHTAQDVLLAATGPGSERVHGFLDNTDIFRISRDSLMRPLFQPPSQQTR